MRLGGGQFYSAQEVVGNRRESLSVHYGAKGFRTDSGENYDDAENRQLIATWVKTGIFGGHEVKTSALPRVYPVHPSTVQGTLALPSMPFRQRNGGRGMQRLCTGFLCQHSSAIFDHVSESAAAFRQLRSGELCVILTGRWGRKIVCYFPAPIFLPKK